MATSGKIKNNPKQAETVNIPIEATSVLPERAVSPGERLDNLEAEVHAFRLWRDKHSEALAALELKWAKMFGA